MMIHVNVNVNAFSKSLHAFVRIPSSLVVSAFDTGDETSWDQKTIPVHPADGYLT